MEKLIFYLVECIGIDHKPVLAVFSNLELDFLRFLPGYKIIQEKEYTGNLLNFQSEILVENYKKLFYSQTSIVDSRINDESIWLKNNPTKIISVFSKKSIKDSILDYGNCWYPDKTPKENLFWEFIANLCKESNDLTGSIIFEDFESKGILWRFCYEKEKFLEIDWRTLYDSCPILNLNLDYYNYLGIIEQTFGYLNFILKASGELKEYSTKTDITGSKEIAEIKKLIDQKSGRYRDKMKYICGVLKSTSNVTLDDLEWLPEKYKNPLKILDLKEISSCEYRENLIHEKINEIKKINKIGEELQTIFKPGERYPFGFINEKLKKLFEKYHYAKPTMASFLKKFFIVTKCKVNIYIGGETKRVDGYKILKIK